jgi:hypothetical protein
MGRAWLFALQPDVKIVEISASRPGDGLGGNLRVRSTAWQSPP